MAISSVRVLRGENGVEGGDAGEMTLKSPVTLFWLSCRLSRFCCRVA